MRELPQILLKPKIAPVKPDTSCLQPVFDSSTQELRELRQIIGEFDYKLQTVLKKPTEVDYSRNCHGTTMFLLGVHPKNKDSMLGSSDLLERSKEYDDPIIGCIVTFTMLEGLPGHITHSGIIVCTNPLKMIHRTGRKAGAGIRIDLIDDVVKSYKREYEQKEDPLYTGENIVRYRRPN